MTDITHLFSLNLGLTMAAVGLILTGLWLAAVRLRTSNSALYPDGIGFVSVARSWRETLAGIEKVLSLCRREKFDLRELVCDSISRWKGRESLVGYPRLFRLSGRLAGSRLQQ